MIWLVEDDTGIRELMAYTLVSTGFSARGFADGAALFQALETEKPELLLLDVMLPGEDGVEILRRLRARPDTRDLPVIMATARGGEYDKVQALDMGADDYLAKPFGMMEMVSRVRAVLRRAAPKAGAREAVLRAGGVELDPGAHTVTVCGARVELTLKEYELLRLLMENPETVFTRDRLLGELWGYDFDGETRTVDVHIRTLRRKLGRCGGLIGTVRGVGYRLEKDFSAPDA